MERIAELVGRGNEEIMLRVGTKATGCEVCQDGAGTQPSGVEPHASNSLRMVFHIAVRVKLVMCVIRTTSPAQNRVGIG